MGIRKIFLYRGALAMSTFLLFWAVHGQGHLNLVRAATNATEVTVNTTEDELNSDGDCSLREAIQAANNGIAVDACPAGSGDDSVLLPSGTYTLTLAGGREDGNMTGDLDILGSLAIVPTGAGPWIIDGNNIDRVLHVHTGAMVTVTNLEITSGHAPDGQGSGCGVAGDEPCPADDGGGIYNQGTLTLDGVRVYANSSGNGMTGDGQDPGCVGDGGDGGGLANSGALGLVDTIVEGNATGAGSYCAGGAPVPAEGAGGDGGGIHNGGVLVISTSQIRHNATAGSRSGHGGGIVNNGTMTVTASTVTGNFTGDSGGGSSIHGSGYNAGSGGGILNNGSLAVRSSTVSSNSTGNGGDGSQGGGRGGNGGGLANHGSLSLVNCTASGNRTGEGGYGDLPGLQALSGDGGGIFNTGTADIVSSTISDNRTPSEEPGGKGGGIAVQSGTVSVKSTIVADNFSVAVGPDCMGTLASFGHNLLGQSTDCTLQGTITGNLFDQYAHLAPLANYGGSTWTHALFAASPAIDGGSCTDIKLETIATDQRGEPRPSRNACDIGAYEAGADPFHYYHLPIVQYGSQ